MNAYRTVRRTSRRRRFVAGIAVCGMTVVPAVALTSQSALAVTDGPGSSPGWFAPHDGELYFSAYTAANGQSLFKSNGTAGGTKLVDAGVYPTDLTWVGDRLFFDGTAAGVHQLFVSDGTTAGTKSITTVTGGLNASGFVAFRGGALFTGDGPLYGYEPWFSDGTAGGTRIIKDIVKGPDYSYPEAFTLVGDGRTAVFVAYTEAHGEELWRTDGTRAGTTMVKDIYPGPNDSLSEGYVSFVSYEQRAYFLADDGVTGYELWTTDGTARGTAVVRNIGPGSTDMTDGEPTVQGGQANYLDAAVFHGELWFAANDGKHGLELWRTDGTKKGTTLAIDVVKGPRSGAPEDLTAVGGHLFFGAQTVAHGFEPWFTNGRKAGTRLIGDIDRGPQSSDPYGFVKVPGGVVFLAGNPKYGYEVWHATIPGGHPGLVKDILPGAGSSDADDLTRLGSKVLFSADDGVHGNELWVTGGTSAHMVTDLNP